MGRHLVEVRYWKEDGDYHITWREGIEGSYQPISRSQLDKVLDAPHTGAGERSVREGDLPENSGLSYNEAWEFTSHLHSNYDYYFKAGEETDRRQGNERCRSRSTSSPASRHRQDHHDPPPVARTHPRSAGACWSTSLAR